MSGPIRLPESWINRPKKAGTVSAEKRLCDLLALPHPDELPDGGPAFHVGSVAPASSVELVEKITGEWLAEKRAIIARQIAAGEWDGATGADFPGTPWADKDYPLDEGQLSKALAFSVLFLTFRQFLQNVTKGAAPGRSRKRPLGGLGGRRCARGIANASPQARGSALSNPAGRLARGSPARLDAKPCRVSGLSRGSRAGHGGVSVPASAGHAASGGNASGIPTPPGP